MRAASAILIGAVCALGAAAPAAAQPGSGPRETVDQSYTVTTPATATGASFTGSYHAANDPNGNPPYMRRMTFYPPAGTQYDTSVPDRCTASDVELEANGAAACPAGSKIGSGDTRGIIFEPIGNAFTLTPYDNQLDILNNTDEQIMVISNGGLGNTVVRGHMQPDGSVEFAAPTCFPVPPAGLPCARDYVLQTGSTTSMPVYTRGDRAYWTTPPSCPKTGAWVTHVKFWWADGSVDDVATDQPCTKH